MAHHIANQVAPLRRWDDLDSEVQFLDEVVQRLRHREGVRSSRFLWADADDGLPVKDYPTPEDPDLYRVRVQVGALK